MSSLTFSHVSISYPTIDRQCARVPSRIFTATPNYSFEKLLGKVIAKKPLHEYGMKEEEIESFAVSVEKSQQRLLNQSYVKLDIPEMMEIYRALY